MHHLVFSLCLLYRHMLHWSAMHFLSHVSSSGSAWSSRIFRPQHKNMDVYGPQEPSCYKKYRVTEYFWSKSSCNGISWFPYSNDLSLDSLFCWKPKLLWFDELQKKMWEPRFALVALLMTAWASKHHQLFSAPSVVHDKSGCALSLKYEFRRSGTWEYEHSFTLPSAHLVLSVFSFVSHQHVSSEAHNTEN